MAEPTGELNQEEKQIRNEMLFTLSELDRGTLAMVVTPNEWKRKELYQFLKNHLKEYEVFDLDLTSYNYSSLYRALNELLPQTILKSQPAQYLVNITGLENSLYSTEDGKIEFSPLVAQLNFERELIFNQPYIIVLWVSESFDRELRRKAPDLMQWMSKRFVFEERGSDGMEVAEAEIEYGTVEKKGRIPERLERIGQLQEVWQKLSLDNTDRIRLIKDKIDLLLLLGKEYAAAFEFQQAENAFKKAIALNSRMKVGREMDLLYEMGTFYWQFRRDDLALENFQHVLTLAQKQDNPKIGDIYHMLGMVYANKRNWGNALTNYRQALDWYNKMGNEYTIGNTYHQIGRAYEEQKKWSEALENYRHALEWYPKVGNMLRMGNTYHQIGIVYAGQRKWNEALVNYQQALEWKSKTGNEYQLGSTYHQIGRAFEEQGKWNEALSSYQQALEWKTRTGNEYEIGATYHQIGMVYEEQGKWDEALVNYQQALEWKVKAGNEYELGSTYHQMGRIYEEQKRYVQAWEWYDKSVKNLTKNDHPFLSTAQKSLARIQQKIAEQHPNP